MTPGTIHGPSRRQIPQNHHDGSVNEIPPQNRPTSHWAKRGLWYTLGLALIVEAIALGLGLSDEGYGWAFEMPAIALLGIIGVTAGVGALILGILRLTHQRGREASSWLGVALAVIISLGGALLTMIAIAASASV